MQISVQYKYSNGKKKNRQPPHKLAQNFSSTKISASTSCFSFFTARIFTKASPFCPRRITNALPYLCVSAEIYYCTSRSCSCLVGILVSKIEVKISAYLTSLSDTFIFFTNYLRNVLYR